MLMVVVVWVELEENKLVSTDKIGTKTGWTSWANDNKSNDKVGKHNDACELEKGNSYNDMSVQFSAEESKMWSCLKKTMKGKGIDF